MKIYSLLISDGQCLLNKNIKKFTNSSFVSMQPELIQNIYLILFELQTKQLIAFRLFMFWKMQTFDWRRCPLLFPLILIN